MIRWLFLVLIIVNLGVFAWGMQRELRPALSYSAADATAPRLALLSEPEAAGEPAAAAPLAPASVPASVLPPVDPDPMLSPLSVQTGSDPGPAESQARSPADAEAVPASGTESAGEEAVAEASQPEATESEILDSSLAGEEPPLPATPPLSVQPPEPNCYTIGPFAERDEAEGLQAALRAEDLDAILRREAQQEQKGYWVLIPPLGSRAEAAAEVDRIKAKGIDDVWRFNKGEMANAISLGLFARRSQAETHQRDLTRKGVRAEVQARYVERAAFYVDTGPSLRPDQEKAWAERIAGEYSEQAIQGIACP